MRLAVGLGLCVMLVVRLRRGGSVAIRGIVAYGSRLIVPGKVRHLRPRLALHRGVVPIKSRRGGASFQITHRRCEPCG